MGDRKLLLRLECRRPVGLQDFGAVKQTTYELRYHDIALPQPDQGWASHPLECPFCRSAIDGVVRSGKTARNRRIRTFVIGLTVLAVAWAVVNPHREASLLELMVPEGLLRSDFWVLTWLLAGLSGFLVAIFAILPGVRHLATARVRSRGSGHAFVSLRRSA